MFSSKRIVFPVSYLNMNWVNEQVINTGSGEPLVWKINRKKKYICTMLFIFNLLTWDALVYKS